MEIYISENLLFVQGSTLSLYPVSTSSVDIITRRQLFTIIISALAAPSRLYNQMKLYYLY